MLDKKKKKTRESAVFFAQGTVISLGRLACVTKIALALFFPSSFPLLNRVTKLSLYCVRGAARAASTDKSRRRRRGCARPHYARASQYCRGFCF